MSYAKRKYYINATVRGNREVHHESCTYLSGLEAPTYLGEFYSSMAAVVAAMKQYPTADLCKTCSSENHTE